MLLLLRCCSIRWSVWMDGWGGWRFDGDGYEGVVLQIMGILSVVKFLVLSASALCSWVFAHLPANNHYPSISRPGQGECLASDV